MHARVLSHERTHGTFAGMDAWCYLSRMYAAQLERTNQPHQAATHLLACHQVHEAVSVYRRASMYREAITIARMRLPQDDESLLQLWREWGDVLEASNLHEYAAQCFIRAGAQLDALRALSRRGDSATLEAALKLARKIGHTSVKELEDRALKAKEKDTERQTENTCMLSSERFSSLPSVVSWFVPDSWIQGKKVGVRSG